MSKNDKEKMCNYIDNMTFYFMQTKPKTFVCSYKQAGAKNNEILLIY